MHLKFKPQNLGVIMRNKSSFVNAIIFALLVSVVIALPVSAVSSKVIRQSSNSELAKGETDGTVIDSDGNIQLGRAAETIVEKFEDVWAINSIVVNGSTIYIGTSPNGGVYKYSMDQLTKIYPIENNEPFVLDGEEPDDANANDPNVVDAEKHLTNEHIFAMASDISGRLLVGVSGENCKLMRLENDQLITIFEPNENDAKYIFAINVNDKGDIYLGTGPDGKIYKLDSLGQNPEEVYDSTDNNILSLASGKDGVLYAGSDNRGLVYKVDIKNKTATVLYDSDQPEITALLVAQNGELYAAATSAKMVEAQTDFAAEVSMAGRPEVKSEKKEPESKSGLRLNIPNTKKSTNDKAQNAPPAAAMAPAKPDKASYVYKISPEGFVTDVFSQQSVFFGIAENLGELLIGTGNNAELFTVNPVEQQSKVVYKDQQASQITAVVVEGGQVYLGTSNPAKLVKLGNTFQAEGQYLSDLIDASQPAQWGKLQIEADIPDGTSVSVASRSSNVKDVNDPSFSQWTQAVNITEPVQLRCPVGRFCQYKLIFKTSDGLVTPVVKEIAVASTVANLTPQIKAVSVARDAEKKGFFKLAISAKDDNSDELIFKIDLRQTGRTNWIQIKDDVDKPVFEWDAKTVEDGRYEIRVTANDRKSNSPETKLTSSRISDAFVVDNSGPDIIADSIENEGSKVTLKLKAEDQFSIIGKVEYTIDSNEKWQGTIPEDLVYDTIIEDFIIVTEKLEAGDHVITIKAADDIGNTTYKTFEVTID